MAAARFFGLLGKMPRMLISFLLVSLAAAIGLGVTAVIHDRTRTVRVRQTVPKRLKR